MPKRQDIHRILLIGSGPIVIGQACEFDYSGTQAVKALKEEGYEVILVNSNPATIMTDPEFAHRTYVEPITPEMVEKIIEADRPDALLPTLGGQTALNTAVALADRGTLARFGVRMIGADAEVIRRAEERTLFKETIERIGLDLPRSGLAHTLAEARRALEEIGLPCVIRPSFTLGGTGGGIARTREAFEEIAGRGLALSMTSEILVEESVEGWKEFELEVMRDRADNAVIVCSIENVDPMGIHTGDSITVAPAQTLTDKEYQRMRDAAIAILRAVGVETGGSNIQFAVDPATGRMVVIEMNPRVSRSSALASKATGFPIAKIAAKLAVGYTLDEIPNDITRKTPACFEPTIDYVVLKIPRFAFEKFPGADRTLGTQMKSVGEVMAIGRTFKESLQKAIRSLDIGRDGLGFDRKDRWALGDRPSLDAIRASLATPNEDRLYAIRDAFRAGLAAEEIHRLSRIDPWFLDQVREIVSFGEALAETAKTGPPGPALLREAKGMGFSDRQLARIGGRAEAEVREERRRLGVTPVYKLVDTCAAEFEAVTPYYYSTYEAEDEVREGTRPKVMILGGGPNRIGQGIEFDYCCVHACMALREEGFETIMVNCNPETVSTDYDTADRLYFEPLTLEDVLHIHDRERPAGTIVQFGGQTPLNLAAGLAAAGVRILGTSPSSIHRAEDREAFNLLAGRLGIRQPRSGIARSAEEAVTVAGRIGFPLLVRPSYVLGGRAMEIVYERSTLVPFVEAAEEAAPGHPILIDEFLDDAIEVDVDCVADGERVVIGGVMEHIEMAGIHSGDSACALPPYSLPPDVVETIRRHTVALAQALEVRGLMNVQFAVQGREVFVLEVNPRASRTVPFVSKAIGRPLAKIAAKVMAGRTLAALGFTEEVTPGHVSVKECVLPFNKLPGCDILLGPEMKSTGEVMGMDFDFGSAYAKSQIAAGAALPLSGAVLVTVNRRDRTALVPAARRLRSLGFDLLATEGTHDSLRENGVPAERILKIKEGSPNVLDAIEGGRVSLVVNTPTVRGPGTDEARIRRAAIMKGIPCITTIAAAKAAVEGIAAVKRKALQVYALQDLCRRAPEPAAPSVPSAGAR